MTIVEALAKLKSGEVSSVELVEECFDKIEKHDRKIQAFISLLEEKALNEAKLADKSIFKEGVKAFE